MINKNMCKYKYMYVYMIMCMCKGSDCLQTAAGTLTAPGAALSIGAAIKDHWTQRSPTWHRRLRSRRSQARKCLQAGLPLSRRARQLLSFHHGTCPYHRRVILFFHGRKGTKAMDKRARQKSGICGMVPTRSPGDSHTIRRQLCSLHTMGWTSPRRCASWFLRGRPEVRRRAT